MKLEMSTAQEQQKINMIGAELKRLEDQISSLRERSPEEADNAIDIVHRIMTKGDKDGPRSSVV